MEFVRTVAPHLRPGNFNPKQEDALERELSEKTRRLINRIEASGPSLVLTNAETALVLSALRYMRAFSDPGEIVRAIDNTGRIFPEAREILQRAGITNKWGQVIYPDPDTDVAPSGATKDQLKGEGSYYTQGAAGKKRRRVVPFQGRGDYISDIGDVISAVAPFAPLAASLLL